ncbi:MAG: efflux RND transporter permease subunit [Spirochaetales bacterium]|nr:efflux RND transporter permease subunit [Spirochaetales bacterium]
MKFAKRFFKRPRLIIAACVIITGVLGFFIKDLAIDNSIRQFLPQKDASYTRLSETEDQFGSMMVIGVSLEAKNGSILTPEYIDVIRDITDRSLELREVSDVDSLTHIDFVCESDGSISASQLIPESYTGSPEDIEQLERRLNEWDAMYNRVIVNDNLTGTQLQITLASYDTDYEAELAAQLGKKKIRSEAEMQEGALNAVTKIVNEATAGHNLDVKIYGNPVVMQNSRVFMLADLARLIPLVIVVVLLSLYFSFKTMDGTLLPLITVVMATSWTMGLMSLFHVTFTLVSSVIPVALIAVGSAYGIHVLTHYYVALDMTEGELTQEKYKEAVFNGLHEVMSAVFLAGITTIIGFISLISSPIAPLHSFAVFTAVGVAISLLLAITFIPAILLLKDFKKVQSSRNKKHHLTEKLARKIEQAARLRGGKTEDEAQGDTLYQIYHFFCGSKTRLYLSIIVMIGVSVAGLRMLKIDTALVNYFPESCDMRQDMNYIDKQFAGTNSLYLNVKGPEKGSLTNPEILKAVDDLQNYMQEEFPDVGKIVSFTDFIKRINQVWHVPASAEDTVIADYSEEDSFESDSFADFADFGEDSFASDTFADSGEDIFADDTFDSFGDDEFADSEETAFDASNWEDPNKAYSVALEQTATVEEVINMLNRAYISAGGKTAKVEDIVNELQKQVNYNGTAYYEIPYDYTKYPVASREELSGVVQGYLTLLSGSLDRFVDDDMNPQIMRITVQLRNHSTQTTGEIIAAAQKFAENHFPEGYSLEATGTAEMEYTMTKMIVSSQLTSLLISLLCVFIIIAVAFKSGWAGLLGAVPLALAIILNYMVMGFAGINLDLVTSIIASVAVGVGIDYTIHFLTTYKEERSKSDDLDEVTRMTFRKSGHGIVTNAIAVGFGFLVLCFSKFVVLRYIGILVAIVMFTSSFLAMTVIPGFLNMYAPKFISKKSSK